MLHPAPDVVARQLGESAVLIRLTTNRIYELNLTGARLWELVGSGATVGSILERLTEEFDAPPDTIRGEIEDLVRDLLAEGLVVEG